MLNITSPPLIVKKMFPDIIWENVQDEIVLTFDDGPHPIATAKVLNVLARRNLKAIFFLIGENIVKYPKVVESISVQGSFIANHSYRHSKDFFLKGKNQIVDDIVACQDLITLYPNYLNFFRPPYGRLKRGMQKVVKDLGLKTMMWTKLTEDWTGDMEKVKKNVMDIKKSNSIIIFHDNDKTVAIIERILVDSIKILEDKGFNFARTFDF